MINRYLQHVLVLPEDGRDRQIVNGFILGVDNDNKIEAKRPAGGWPDVLRFFEKEYVDYLRKYRKGLLILVIDFDQVEDRFSLAKARVPGDLEERVFIIGARKDPERIKQTMRDLGSYEGIGQALAKDCRDGTQTIWGRPDLACNMGELERMNATVRSCLFD